MPFVAFLQWVSLEMYLGKLDAAETLINDYISLSSHLADPKPAKKLGAIAEADEESKDERMDTTQITTTSNTSNYPWLRKSTSTLDSSFFKTDNYLPLAANEYYQLVELLVFKI